MFAMKKRAVSQSIEVSKAASKWGAIPFIGGCIAVGFSGSYLGGAFKKHDWVDNNPKPAIWPPQWAFPVVWIGNYTLMGLATWEVWKRRKEKEVSPALWLFGLHLLHNFLFIPTVYKAKKRSVYVLMDSIGVLLGAATTRAYSKVSRPATLWMLPYLGWLGFTTFIKVLWWRMASN